MSTAAVTPAVAPIVPATSSTGASGEGTNKKEDTRPWVEKYRPSTIDDVVAHEDIIATLRRLVDNNNIPHLLFYGPAGTGKTSTVQALARYIFSGRTKGNVLEMNASDDRGIDTVRNQIKDFASTGSMFVRQGQPAMIKLIVLDEADQMSHDAQAALRRVIERYTKNVRFCILCNHVNKIIPAVQSRCTRFRFGPVKKSQMIPRLHFIVAQEKLKYTEDGLNAAFKLCNGDMRRCLNTIQASSLAYGEVTERTIYQCTGNPTPQDVRQIVEAMVGSEFDVAWEKCSAVVEESGASVVDLVREVHSYVIRMDLPVESKCFCLMKLADIEYNLAAGTGEQAALAALLGTMQLVRESVTKKVSIMVLAKA